MKTKKINLKQKNVVLTCLAVLFAALVLAVTIPWINSNANAELNTLIEYDNIDSTFETYQAKITINGQEDTIIIISDNEATLESTNEIVNIEQVQFTEENGTQVVIGEYTLEGQILVPCAQDDTEKPVAEPAENAKKSDDKPSETGEKAPASTDSKTNAQTKITVKVDDASKGTVQEDDKAATSSVEILCEPGTTINTDPTESADFNASVLFFTNPDGSTNCVQATALNNYIFTDFRFGDTDVTFPIRQKYVVTKEPITLTAKFGTAGTNDVRIYSPNGAPFCTVYNQKDVDTTSDITIPWGSKPEIKSIVYTTGINYSDDLLVCSLFGKTLQGEYYITTEVYDLYMDGYNVDDPSSQIPISPDKIFVEERADNGNPKTIRIDLDNPGPTPDPQPTPDQNSDAQASESSQTSDFTTLGIIGLVAIVAGTTLVVTRKIRNK